MTATSVQSASAINAANPFPDLPAIRGPDSSPPSTRPTPRRFPSPRFGDYARARSESRAAFGGDDASEDAEEVLRQEWKEAARFYARFGITSTEFQSGVADGLESPQNYGGKISKATSNLHQLIGHCQISYVATMTTETA